MKPLECRLSHISLDIDADNGKLTTHKLRSLLSSSSESLESFRLGDLGYDDPASITANRVVSFFATNRFPRLRTLIIDSWQPYTFYSKLLTCFPALESLVFTIFDPKDLDSIADFVTPQVTYLAIITKRWSYRAASQEAIRKTLSGDNLRNVRTLGLPETKDRKSVV